MAKVKLIFSDNPADIAASLKDYPSVFVIGDRRIKDTIVEPMVEILAEEGVALRGVLSIRTSERRKTFRSVERIHRWLISAGADRNALVLAIGGGITTDLVGFAACTYKRGVKYANVPTTLLAQVDAGIGGKTGCNIGGYKNMAGVICQPQFTFICPEFVRSLDWGIFSAGYAELLKTFIIGDAEAYARAVTLGSALSGTAGTAAGSALSGTARKAAGSALSGEAGSAISATASQATGSSLTGRESSPKITDDVTDGLGALVERAARIKAEIVEADEHEGGLRRVLNLGHTFAHAIEYKSSHSLLHRRISHGHAVAIGMVMAARLSETEGIAPKGLAERIKADFQSVGLPVSCPWSEAELREVMATDKKAEGGKINFVLIEDIGKVLVRKF